MPVRVATVRAADVPATQTDFPFYVDLGRVGATALTLADAQSSRWYTDTDLVTQMAREIVSLTEGHGKYASLTSTSKIAIDYDGIRADYAVGDTFGRNNVWSAYRGIYHLDGVTDSFGSNDLVNTNSITFPAGKIGNAASAGSSNTNKKLSVASNLSVGSGDLTYSYWFRNDGTDREFDAMFEFRTGHYDYVSLRNGNNNRWWGAFGGNILQTVGISSSTWFWITVTVSSTTVTMFVNNSSIGTTTRAASSVSSLSILRSDKNNWWGTNFVDEVRVTSALLTANWITTEYNNQNDEATFWGTWTTFDGGASAVNARRLFLMMM